MVCIDSHKKGVGAWLKRPSCRLRHYILETDDRVYHAAVTFLKCGDNGDIFDTYNYKSSRCCH